MNKSAPAQKMRFTMGDMADGNLLKLIEVINKYNYQSMTAQSAIWAITDNNDITDVYSENFEEKLKLRKFAADLKAKEKPLENVPDDIIFFKIKTDINDSTYLKYSIGKVEGAIQFELTEDAQLYLTLYNEKGGIAKSCFQNKLYKAGTNTIKYDFGYYTVPKGNYHLKLYDSNGNILVDKFMTFKTAVHSF